MGIVGAWASSVLASAGRIGRIASHCFLLAMVTAVATPLILHAAAWEATAGKFGWWTMTQTGVRTDAGGVYGYFSGLLACGWIHGSFGAAIVALATWHGARQTPSAVVEQSRLDFGPITRWWKVRLPIAAPWLVGSLLGTATLAATEMTVVDLYGFETIADEFYRYYAVDPSLLQILWTCAFPLALAGVMLMWLFVSRRRLLELESNVHPVQVETDTPPPAILFGCFLVVSLIAALVALVPITGLFIKAGHQVTIEQGSVRAVWSAAACWEHIAAAPKLFFAEYQWTALIGVVTAALSTLIAWPLAMLGRSYRKLERGIDFSTVLVFTIPGPVVGMAVVHLFQMPVPGFRFLYGQTIGPTVIALLVRALPVAYWVLRSGYRGIHQRVLDQSRLDLSWFRRVWFIDRPLLGRHLVLAFLASGLVASGDVPATLPVIPAGVTTVGTRLFELLHSGARYQEASLAIWYVAGVVVVAIIWVRQFRGSRVE